MAGLLVNWNALDANDPFGPTTIIIDNLPINEQAPIISNVIYQAIRSKLVEVGMSMTIEEIVVKTL